MPTITYEDITPSLIPNTTMQKWIMDGVHRAYRIYPIADYVLHDNTLDEPLFDENTMESIGVKFGYSPSGVYVTCGANYDFTAHTVIDENGVSHTAYGNRDFFAVPENTVPADQIFGDTNNDHEVM